MEQELDIHKVGLLFHLSWVPDKKNGFGLKEKCINQKLKSRVSTRQWYIGILF